MKIDLNLLLTLDSDHRLNYIYQNIFPYIETISSLDLETAYYLIKCVDELTFDDVWHNVPDDISQGRSAHKRRLYEESPSYQIRKRCRHKYDGNCCLCCGLKGRLEIHHFKYNGNGANYYAEDLKDLGSFCRKCHERITKNKNSYRNLFKKPLTNSKTSVLISPVACNKNISNKELIMSFNVCLILHTWLKEYYNKNSADPYFKHTPGAEAIVDNCVAKNLSSPASPLSEGQVYSLRMKANLKYRAPISQNKFTVYPQRHIEEINKKSGNDRELAILSVFKKLNEFPGFDDNVKAKYVKDTERALRALPAPDINLVANTVSIPVNLQIVNNWEQIRKEANSMLAKKIADEEYAEYKLLHKSLGN